MYDAGIFLKNYIEYIEEVPNDIQKCITKFREVDSKTRSMRIEVNLLQLLFINFYYF